MKQMITKTGKLSTIALIGLLIATMPGRALAAQQPQLQQPQLEPAPSVNKEAAKKRPRIVGSASEQKSQDKSKSGQTSQPPSVRAGERMEPDDTTVAPVGVPDETLANRHEQMTEDAAAVVPYYNNFMSSYRLGPEDVISVTVFGQERYSKSGIVVSPDGKISIQLVPEGIFVAGKTTQQVAEEITKRYDEFIIDPKVNVSLEKAMSARFAVLGDVGQPGIKILSRRLSVSEALAEAGGVLPTGDKKKVILLRRRADGFNQQIPINLAAIEKGRMADNMYIVPGDQVFVPGNTLKKVQSILNLVSIASFARIFTGGW